MPSHQRNTAVIRWMLFVCLLCSGSRLEAQIEAQTPVLTQDAPSKSKETSDDSELKIQNYQLKHAKAAEVLKLFKQLHGGKTTATIDERTNSIVFLANETNARELRESLALLDGPTPVLKGSSPQAPRQSTYTQLPEESKPAGPFRKFTFKHAKVADVVKILRELTGANIDNEDMEGFAVDERTNSVIWKVKDEWNSRHWEETLLTLDGENSTSRIQSAPSRYAAPASMPTPIDFATLNSQVSAQPTQTFTFSMGFERGESVEALKQRYNELEKQTHQLADKLKQSKSPSEPERTELTTAVRKSFEARQALQRAELADLAQRMKSMQQSIDMRDKLADKVIERRIEDLLNPNLKWDLLAAKDRTLDGHNSESSNGSATTAQSAPETPTLTPESSAYLPPSIAPTPISARYDPGKRPETIIMERIQGEWIAESMISAGKDSLSDYSEPFEVLITGNEMRFKVGDQDLSGPNPMLLAGPKGSFRSIVSADQPMPIDIVMDPNGENREMRSIIACDGTTLSICFADEDESKSGFRPSSFIPGSKVVVIKCYRLTPTVPANKPGAANLSTPQATLDYLHRYSLAHPDGFPAECYTDEALLELSGMMLQNLSMMSAMSQIALQTGGVIGESNGVPVVSDTSPAFHIGVEALLKEHMLPTPPESADKAFELLATLTFGGDSSNPTAAVKVDRRLLRLAAGVLKSPKEFLPAAGKLLETFGETAADVTKSQKADQTQPKADIAINGDEATATFTSSGNVASPSPLSWPRVTKLRRIDGRWLISEILSDQEITQMQSSMSSVMNQLRGAEAKFDTPQALLARVDECSIFDWNDLLKLVPESGTVLMMFSHEPDKREQMLPIAEKVAEEAKVKLIHLPIDNWRTLFSKEATHFVLMKDRQLIGTKTGLVTEAKLKEFVAQAKDWLTPHSTGVMESSLVRVDCYISPGKDNIGSQHGPAIPITLAVVAIDGDEALLFGTEGIAKYLEKGCACVAIVRDEKGNEKQVPLEVVLTGNVPLKKPDALNDDDALVITIPFFNYDKEYIELQEAYDVGSAIYRIRGAHGLTTVKLAPFDSTPQKGERVLAGEFNSSRHHGPILGFQSPFHWQTQQNLSESDWYIYGGNIHGAKMFEVLCPTIPAPSSFLFNAHGRLIGTRGLGKNLTEKDKTYTALMPYAIHSVLHAGLEAIAHAGLKAALKQTLEESTSQT